MVAMVAVFSLLFVLGASIVITRIATIMLIHTGVSSPMARFQARSAFTGVGFTTRESEQMVRHPVRRRIILTLMLLGNAGVIWVLASLLLAFFGEHYYSWPVRMGILIGGLLLLWFLAWSRAVDLALSHLIEWALARWSKLEVHDYESVLRLKGRYDVVELEVGPDHWMAGKTLAQLRLRDEGVNVLGIDRDHGPYIGAPNGDTRVRVHDVLVLYGRSDRIEDLGERHGEEAGEKQHQRAVAEQERVREAEEDAERQADAEAHSAAPM